MTKCQGRNKKGASCRMQAVKNSFFCYHHQPQQVGRGSGVDLSLGRNKFWKLLSKAQTQHKALEEVGNSVILPDAVAYKIQIPCNVEESGVATFTMRGPVTLAQLLRMVDSDYEEHGATVRNIADMADGVNVVALEHLGGSVYGLVLN